MSAPDEIARRRSVHTLLCHLAGFGLAAAYCTLFWSSLWERLPAPFSVWGRAVRRELWSIWRDSPIDWLRLTIVQAIVVPCVVMACVGRSPQDFGLGWPNRLGWRLAWISVIISIPFGWWLIHADPGEPTHHVSYEMWVTLAGIIPEHALICGLFVTVFLPGLSLHRARPPVLTGGASVTTRAFRRLGLAQPPREGGSRVLGWFGLNGRALWAISASGVLFFAVHFGKDLAELATSLPGGVAIAYVTLRSRSIWPAVVAHWALNLIPKAMLYARTVFDGAGV